MSASIPQEEEKDEVDEPVAPLDDDDDDDDDDDYSIMPLDYALVICYERSSLSPKRGESQPLIKI